MSSEPLPGIVYMAWDSDLLADEPQPRFSGHREDGDTFEDGPAFDDASDAVRWWRERGAGKILIRLDHSGYLWAGVGPPPVDPETGHPMPVFSDDDPAGRPEDSLARAKAEQRELREQEAARRANQPYEMGARLRARREAVGLSIEGLAERVESSPGWIESVEAGQTASALSLSHWVDLVWATREPWPDQRRFRNTGSYGWVAYDLLTAAEDIVPSRCG